MLRRFLVVFALLGIGVAFGQVSMSEVFLAMSGEVGDLSGLEVTGFHLVGSEAEWGTPVFSTAKVVVYLEVAGWSGNVEIAGAGLYNLLEWWVVGKGQALGGLYGAWWVTSNVAYSCDYGAWGWENSGVESAAVVCTADDFPKSVSFRTRANYLGGASGWSSNGGSTRLNGDSTHTYSTRQGCDNGGSVEWELFGVGHGSSASAHNAARQTVEARLLPLFNRSARCGPWHVIVDSDPSIEIEAAAAALAYLAVDSSGFSPDDFFVFGSPAPEFVDDTGGDGGSGNGGGGGGPGWDDAPGDPETNCSIIDIPCNLRKLFVPTEDWGARFGQLPETHADRFPFALGLWSPGGWLNYSGLGEAGGSGDMTQFTCPTVNIHFAIPGGEPGPLGTADEDYNWCDNAVMDKWIEWGRPLLLWVFAVSLIWAGYRRVAAA